MVVATGVSVDVVHVSTMAVVVLLGLLRVVSAVAVSDRKVKKAIKTVVFMAFFFFMYKLAPKAFCNGTVA